MDRLDQLLAKPHRVLTDEERQELHCLMFDLPDYEDDVQFLKSCGIRVHAVGNSEAK